jgi:hypothetical protein
MPSSLPKNLNQGLYGAAYWMDWGEKKDEICKWGCKLVAVGYRYFRVKGLFAAVKGWMEGNYEKREVTIMCVRSNMCNSK